MLCNVLNADRFNGFDKETQWKLMMIAESITYVQQTERETVCQIQASLIYDNPRKYMTLKEMLESDVFLKVDALNALAKKRWCGWWETPENPYILSDRF